MTVRPLDLDSARAEISAASSGGAPFLFAFALTLGLTGAAGFWLDVRTTALITLFQGNVALPLAFWLERRMSTTRMSDTNPLKPLSIQLAMSQVLALPAVFIVYQFFPAGVPTAMAAVGAAHFLPYTWLQRRNSSSGGESRKDKFPTGDHSSSPHLKMPNDCLHRRPGAHV